MSKQAVKILAECLDATEQDRLSIQEFMEKYPEQEAELAALLATAGQIRSSATGIMPRPQFRSSARARLLEKLPEQPTTFWAGLRNQWKSRWMVSSRRFATAWILLIVVFVTVFSGSGVVYASTSALPGDLLYGVKGLVENVRLSMANEQSALALQFRFTQRRLGEMESLIARNRAADMPEAIEGYLNALQSMTLIMEQEQNQGVGATVAELALVKQIQTKQLERLEHMLGEVPESLGDQLELAIQAAGQFDLNSEGEQIEEEAPGDPPVEGVTPGDPGTNNDTEAKANYGHLGNHGHQGSLDQPGNSGYQGNGWHLGNHGHQSGPGHKGNSGQYGIKGKNGHGNAYGKYKENPGQGDANKDKDNPGQGDANKDKDTSGQGDTQNKKVTPEVNETTVVPTDEVKQHPTKVR